jgi:hypothetical protein
MEALQVKCYIFDIDGTIADGIHRLHHIEKTPKDWDAFYADCPGDKPIPHMHRLLEDLYCVGGVIVYVTGRSDQIRDETEAWLFRHGFPTGGNNRLYMRKAGDYRPDDVLKIELLAELRADGYEPIMAFEDRTRVVKAWRAAGIPCAQVVEGDY